MLSKGEPTTKGDAHWLAAAASVWLLVLACGASAQPAAPHIGYVFPAGGRRGSVAEVTIGGQYLKNATNAYVSGSGVEAAFVEYARPLTAKEFNDLREKLRDLQERRAAA